MTATTTCAFGTPTMEHAPHVPPLFACDGCRSEEARMLAEFRAAVAAGTYDAQGYTPSERRAKNFKRTER